MQEELMRKARELPRQSFVAQYPQVFFVYGLGAEGVKQDFKTGYFPSVPRRNGAAATMRVSTVSSIMPLADPSQAGILLVTKSARNPYSDRISIGRAASCDMVLQVAHISKLHAHFLLDPSGRWAIRDAESTNGTFVNGMRAEPGIKLIVRPGDQIRLAQCEARFLDAERLFDLLNTPRH